jgi:hypothetical protein
MAAYRSQPLELGDLDAEELSRADLVFYEVDHAGVSYEALVYVDPPDGEELGHREPDRGYAGSFTVFGHAGCYGDEGHCDPAERVAGEFDRRPSHPLTPFTKTVIATEAVTRALGAGRATVTVLVLANVPEPEEVEDAADPLRFSHVRLLTYEG